MTLEPYVKDTVKKQQLEMLAEQYCLEKRSVSTAKRSELLPDNRFTTDGCSRWFDASWVSCCIVHDIVYWCGGSVEDREEADQIVLQCVNKKAAFMGDVMHPGIRTGGVPWLPTPWRWGYGWNEWPRDYEKLPEGQSITIILEKLNIQKIIEDQFTIKR
jgi:hypothetical protein